MTVTKGIYLTYLWTIPPQACCCCPASYVLTLGTLEYCALCISISHPLSLLYASLHFTQAKKHKYLHLCTTTIANQPCNSINAFWDLYTNKETVQCWGGVKHGSPCWLQHTSEQFQMPKSSSIKSRDLELNATDCLQCGFCKGKPLYSATSHRVENQQKKNKRWEVQSPHSANNLWGEKKMRKMAGKIQ